MEQKSDSFLIKSTNYINLEKLTLDGTTVKFFISGWLAVIVW
jgi:hypothetical protein